MKFYIILLTIYTLLEYSKRWTYQFCIVFLFFVFLFGSQSVDYLIF